MKHNSIGEFEELVLLMVAALHDEAYGVSIQEKLAEQLSKNINISAVHVALKRMEEQRVCEITLRGYYRRQGRQAKKVLCHYRIGETGA